MVENKNDYLNEVIFHIRYSPILELYCDDRSAAADFQNVVACEFGDDVQFQESRKFSVKVTGTGKTIENKTNDEFVTWKFISNSGKYIALNGKELILSYSANGYSNFTNFMSDINLIIMALKKYSINQINCLGLRYINQIEINDLAIDQYINPNLLFVEKFHDDNVIQSITRTEFEMEDYILAFQFGLFNPQYPNMPTNKEFILDYDCILNNDEDIDLIPFYLKDMHDIISNRFKKDMI
ncbi:TIGR04255 family protein [Methanobrevibacter sp.]|uniref:TIGR04255 family protein n=1 Tax=Methanobrevibacter sp. TaxID=66852 RepID=UPI00388EAAF8